MPKIEIKSITIQFDQKLIFEQFSYQFITGIYAIMGPNGIGKSSLLHALSGSNQPSQGSIHILGHDLYQKPKQAKQHLFYIPDNAVFYPFITGYEFINFVLKVYQREQCLQTHDYQELIDLFNLQDYLSTRFGEASLGTRMKFFLTAGLLIKPPILIMDEPFNGLDQTSFNRLIDILNTMTVDSTVILSTHNNLINEALSTRRLMLNSIPNINFDES